MIGEYLRLAFGTFMVLLPGRLIARALGQRATSATLAWAFASFFVVWLAVFAVHGTVVLATALLGLIGIVALVVPRRQPRIEITPIPGWRAAPIHRGRGLVFGGGIVLGLLLWQVAGAVVGDGLFHLARVVKLVDLGDLHLRTVDEFADGGLHPGYAFPLWHGFLALVSQVSGVSPQGVVNHESSLLVPLVCVVLWEAGVAVFRASGAGFSVLFGSLAMFCFAAGHGGAWVSLSLPATGSRQLLVPAAFALFFTFAESGRRADLAALALVFGALALVHPTYALFALIPLGAYSAVRFPEWRRSARALGACLVPTAIAVAWLKPIVDQTLSHNPTAEAKAVGLRHYAGELSVSSPTHFHLAAEVFGRTGAVAIAALVFVPLAGVAVRKRWGSLVLGGALAVLLLMLTPVLFVHFSDAVSLSQARRAAGFFPFAFAFAGGFALLARFPFALPISFVAGFALQEQWPGDFAYGLREGGPAVVTWFALFAGAAALVGGLLLRRGQTPAWWQRERFGLGAVAAAFFVLPIVVHGFGRWSPLHPTDRGALSPAILQELKEVPKRAVIIADPETSYRLLAAAPVYVVAAPVTHVADTRANDPNRRVADVKEWIRTGDASIARRYGATWAVRDGDLVRLHVP